MKKRVLWSVLSASLLVAWCQAPQARADVTLPKVIGSHMVLQRDQPLPIWGWADPGEKVRVKLDEATATAKADAQGNWKVVLPAVKADGKAHHMSVSGKNRIELGDILIGEVWIGSGQSNMDLTLREAKGAKEAIAAADCPQIRLLHVARVTAKEPAKDIVLAGGPMGKMGQAVPPWPGGSAWKACTPKSVPSFSAVLYYFGSCLQKEIQVPIGLIDSSWGGSPIEAWISSKPKWGGMYNAMIAPLSPLAIRGVIWYQGESNVGNGMKYFDKMQWLVGDWRKAWGSELPFYYVEIAPWSMYKASLPDLWEAQVAALKIPHTGMAVPIDLVDNIGNIHPVNKLDVGNRLALWALAKDYKRNVVYSGPLYRSMKVEGSKIRLSFAHVDGGLGSRDGKPLCEFEVAGADGKFVPAVATIDGGSVLVGSDAVAAPTQARFAWRNVANPNFMNKAGLPASPFRTKDWQGGTGE